MCDVVQDCPGLDVVPVGRDLHVVDPVDEEGQGLQEHQRRHDPVDPEQI